MLEFPKSWFDCQFPKITEAPIWIKHPVFPLEACQYGAIRSTIEDNEVGGCKKSNDAVRNLLMGVTEGKTRDPKYFGKRARLVKECWEGKSLPPQTRLVYWNLNPLDNRPENILFFNQLPNRMRKDYMERQRQFIRNTIKEMLKRQTRLGPDKITEDFWIMLGIPKKIISAWKDQMKQSF